MTKAQEADQPGFRLHLLKGTGRWSVRVSGNWRVVFRFVDGEAIDVDPVDYHWLRLPETGTSSWPCVYRRIPAS